MDTQLPGLQPLLTIDTEEAVSELYDILNSPESDHRFEPSAYITQQQGSVYLPMSDERRAKIAPYRRRHPEDTSILDPQPLVIAPAAPQPIAPVD